MTDASIAQSETPHSSEHPSAATVERLLQVNRDFYAAISAPFHQTRGSIAEGMVRALELLYGAGARDKRQGARGEGQGSDVNPGILSESSKSLDPRPSSLLPSPSSLKVLDAGCGNGRFARALAEYLPSLDYVGLDANADLLANAKWQIEDLPNVRGHFLEADLTAVLPPLPFEKFDLVASLAVLHHMPSRALRQRIVDRLAQVTRRDGYLLISTWQFMESERLAARVQPWEEVGLTAADAEPGDALLPWDQGVHALRYVHLIDETEIAELAAGAQMEVIHTFRADGKGGNLSLYTILRHAS